MPSKTLRRWECALLVLAAALTLFCSWLGGYRECLSGKLLRLHVVANSDSDADQAVKLCVRNAVLREAQRALSGASDAKQAILTDIPALEAAANAELRRQGSGDTACVSFRRELFPTRDYDTFSLPSGVYQSLRVTIGEGAGHNWWCVIFPSLCVPATTDGFADAAAAGGFSDAEIGLMTRAHGAYTVKFRSLELLQALKKYLFGE